MIDLEWRTIFADVIISMHLSVSRTTKRSVAKMTSGKISNMFKIIILSTISDQITAKLTDTWLSISDNMTAKRIVAKLTSGKILGLRY
jgi:hypothetical protein